MSKPSDRGEQLLALREAQLPQSMKVSPGIAKAILRCVDDHGVRCWASVATIASETNFNERTVRRSLTELTERGYLLANYRQGKTTYFSVNWNALNPGLTVLGGYDSTPDSQSKTPDSQSYEARRSERETRRNERVRPLASFRHQV